MTTETVVFTQQDVDDQKSAARLCESLAKKIVAKHGDTIVSASISAQAERHREFARRIARHIGD